MQGLHTPACRIHSSMITCAAPWLPQGHCQRSGSCYYAFWPLLMILADSRAGTRMMHSWCGRSVWTTRQRWQAGAQRLPASLKDYPTYSEIPLRGGDLVPQVRFVEKFCSRTFCRFCGNISGQPVRNTVVADVHGPVDVEFIACRNHMQRELIFPASDRRVFFALILREYKKCIFPRPQTAGHFKTTKKPKRVIFIWKLFRRHSSFHALDKYCLVKERHREVFAHSPIADAQGRSSCQSFPPRASRQSAPVIRLFRSPSRDIFTPPSAHDFGCTETAKRIRYHPLPTAVRRNIKANSVSASACRPAQPS